MAKRKKPDGTDEDDKPSNTTSGGETPEPAGDGPATVEDGAPKGTAVYPPSTSDQAGEKTDNIAPAKKLPPDAPDGGADDLTRVTAERDALAAVVANLGGNPAEVCKTATAAMGDAAKKAKGATKKATVTPKGGNPDVVEYPADATDPHAAAVAAWKEARGVWHLPEQPHVQLEG